MQIRRQPLTPPAPGTLRELASLHFGPGGGRKAVLQAALHADEVPAMLALHHLRARLAELESAGRLRGEIVLVPCANPVGAAQRLLQAHVGRFELGSGENFNRRYPDLLEPVLERVHARPPGAPPLDVAAVREMLRAASAAVPAGDELASLRRALLALAVDADLVLDVHSDNDAVLHLYTTPALWPAVEPLARLLGAEVALLASWSGDEPFDEACSTLWPRLAARLATAGVAHALPGDACVAATVELRGETDVDHALAARDAEALLAYLAVQGFVEPREPVELPPLRRPPRPLEGSMPLEAPHGGAIVWLRHPGSEVRAGETLAEIVDPLTGRVTPVSSPVDGYFYARVLRRWAHAGVRLGKVAGIEPLRSGALLSA